MQRTHDKVVIEERAADEVVRVKGRRIAPKGIPVANPAFDETPPELVSAIITDKGLITRPIGENIAAVMG
jgi:methylthioribose-1-phosphate isomerase